MDGEQGVKMCFRDGTFHSVFRPTKKKARKFALDVETNGFESTSDDGFVSYPAHQIIRVECSPYAMTFEEEE